MPFKIVRNDITKMNCDAIVNTANPNVTVGAGCDRAIYTAAGYDQLLDYRRRNIGTVSYGDVFITPGFNLPARYIIHAVSPFISRESQSTTPACSSSGAEVQTGLSDKCSADDAAEEALRSCYRKSLQLALKQELSSIAFPLIATGCGGYSREDGIRIAADEINTFLLRHDMLIYLVVFDTRATELGEKLYPDLEAYIDHNYVCDRREEEYNDRYFNSVPRKQKGYDAYFAAAKALDERLSAPLSVEEEAIEEADCSVDFFSNPYYQSSLSEHIQKSSATFSERLLQLIKAKNMPPADVYKRAIVYKKVFSKIKNDRDYHPGKITAMCLCVGAKLTIEETNDLLRRAGYALSPCDKTDIIFSYFIEHEIYDMIALDIKLEDFGLPCLIV